ncbi:hypothetical protein AXQ97_004453 [Salmonella enterica subsp. enterica]|nr:hypothetical protein [Salmonella enterica]EEA6506651.1 hypothetical protein [Salmonella enterica subsp. enterica serovar Reading]EEI9132178.1 hypothetical protein [Salmonella enterica subsp. enterica serovar Miami]EIC3513031.1 hypothetical protein [Salmonella enterica subsp. enterica serovar Oranienburg]EEC0578965.1 hypothetical protein [Salmonella enterica]EEJ1579063.1 hypothetical protein [Salmonella enterica subsp. enterica serovar Miami]
MAIQVKDHLPRWWFKDNNQCKTFLLLAASDPLMPFSDLHDGKQGI